MAKAILFALIVAAVGLLVYIFAAPRLVHSTVQPKEPQLAVGTDANSSIRGSASQSSSSSNSPTLATPSPQASPVNNRNVGDGSIDNSPAVTVPQSSEQRSRQTTESMRAPLYDWIRKNMQVYLAGWQAGSDDTATLDLYMKRQVPEDIPFCMDKIVTPYAAHYGFNRVRFSTHNPSATIDVWKVDTEATPDSAGYWHAYKK